MWNPGGARKRDSNTEGSVLIHSSQNIAGCFRGPLDISDPTITSSGMALTEEDDLNKAGSRTGAG